MWTSFHLNGSNVIIIYDDWQYVNKYVCQCFCCKTHFCTQLNYITLHALLDIADKQMRLFVIFEGELDHLLFTSFHIYVSVNKNAYTMIMSLLPIFIY